MKKDRPLIIPGSSPKLWESGMEAMAPLGRVVSVQARKAGDTVRVDGWHEKRVPVDLLHLDLTIARHRRQAAHYMTRRLHLRIPARSLFDGRLELWLAKFSEWSRAEGASRHGYPWKLVAYMDYDKKDYVTHQPKGWGPVLLDLDASDPRLLPDGSRWVDAEALRRVVLHVAGVSA